MATSKDDIKYGTAQARHSEDTTTREAYIAGQPIEGGKIADSEPVDLLSAAHRIAEAKQQQASHESTQDSSTKTSTTQQYAGSD
ncbi:uncharacterized protein LOC113360807 [Papaver somniferum]|uniref:uncharacterized protein LOC113360807 n=1 Tax=Papaver somniferum TaxID=3469 RepID=UPI000E6FFF79|nr:uncharacterized protein LOC113360807 [Papaver somniferum]